jgi:hypothetical protein
VQENTTVRNSILAVGLTAVLLSSAAFAQSPPPAAAPAPDAAVTGEASPEARQRRFAACRDDLQSFCATVEKGGGRKFKCLKDNEAKLQPACKTALSEVEADRAQKKADRQAGQAAAAAASVPAAAAPAPAAK